MPSSLSSRSRSLSRTSGAVLALALGGCGDDTCGTGGAPSSGLVASSADVTLRFGGLSALPGNDCPVPDAPEGVVSLSIEGTQSGGTGRITLCIPRPDRLPEGMRTIGTATSNADIRIIDLNGAVDNCTFTINTAQLPVGEGVATGLCANGTDPAGFALELDGALSLTRTCGTTVDAVNVTLTGRVAVTKR